MICIYLKYILYKRVKTRNYNFRVNIVRFSLIRQYSLVIMQRWSFIGLYFGGERSWWANHSQAKRGCRKPSLTSPGVLKFVLALVSVSIIFIIFSDFYIFNLYTYNVDLKKKINQSHIFTKMLILKLKLILDNFIIIWIFWILRF